MPIRTLLLSGANNHDCKRTSPLFARLLEQTGQFQVTLTENPSTVLEDAAGLKQVDLILSDYNGPDWSDAARRNFTEAVRGGVGFALVHAANNAFTGWTDYETMIALAWREGTGHGQFHEFPVTFRDRQHPITAGLSDFRTTDELYHRLVHMHGAQHQVLATAWSDAGKGGTGKDEPVLVVSQFGKGRIFHHILGHLWPGSDDTRAVDNPGFQGTLIRGCQWAATGTVTL